MACFNAYGLHFNDENSENMRSTCNKQCECDVCFRSIFDETKFLSFFFVISEGVRLIEHIASFSLFALLILFEEIQFSW